MRSLIFIMCCVAGIEQTSWQRELFKNVSETAMKLSHSAEPALLEQMDKMSFRTKLAACCPSLSMLTARELLNRLQDEVRVAEVVSGFGASPPDKVQPGGPGMSLADGLAGHSFQNLWQFALLHNQTFTDSIREIWKTNCSFGGQTVQWEKYSQEGCHEKPVFTVTYPLGECFRDPKGEIFRYTCIRGNTLVMEVWGMTFRPPISKAVHFSKFLDSLVSCPPTPPPTFEFAADGACHSATVWNASSYWKIQDDAEMSSYGLKPFRVRGAPASLAEAAERGPYSIVNLFSWNFGSMFGDVSVVFSAKAVRKTSLISAIDTGTYQAYCVSTQRAVNPFGVRIDCSAYVPYRQLGTFENFNHLFLVSDAVWNGTEQLLLYFARLEGAWGSRLFPYEGVTQYWEVMSAATLQYPSDVRFLIGSFESLFGSSLGEALQKWAKQNGWVLVWSFGFKIDRSRIGKRFPFNDRIVDPEVLSHTSASKSLPTSQNTLRKFRRKWKEVSIWRNMNQPESVQWGFQWDELANSIIPAFRISPLRAGECARTVSEPECIGITGAGHCVCYSHVEWLVTSGVVKDFAIQPPAVVESHRVLRWQQWAIGEKEMPPLYSVVLMSIPFVALVLMVICLRVLLPCRPGLSLCSRREPINVFPEAEGENLESNNDTTSSTPLLFGSQR